MSVTPAISTRFCTFLILAVSAAAFGLRAANAGEIGSPLGYWLTESGDGVIEVRQCENALCGRIAGIGRAANAPIPTDVHGQSQCGLTIFQVENPTPDGV